VVGSLKVGKIWYKCRFKLKWEYYPLVLFVFRLSNFISFQRQNKNKRSMSAQEHCICNSFVCKIVKNFLEHTCSAPNIHKTLPPLLDHSHIHQLSADTFFVFFPTLPPWLLPRWHVVLVLPSLPCWHDILHSHLTTRFSAIFFKFIWCKLPVKILYYVKQLLKKRIFHFIFFFFS